MKVVSPIAEAFGSVNARTRQVPVGTAELSATASARPPAPRQSSLEQHVTGIVGLAGRQNLVIARDQPHLGLRNRFRRRQRIYENMNAVIAREGRQAQIRDDKPLRRQRTV